MAQRRNGTDNEPVMVHSAVPARSEALAPMLDAGTLDPKAVIAHAKNVGLVVDELSAYALAMTEPRHWCNFTEAGENGSPWLTGPGRK